MVVKANGGRKLGRQDGRASYWLVGGINRADSHMKYKYKYRQNKNVKKKLKKES